MRSLLKSRILYISLGLYIINSLALISASGSDDRSTHSLRASNKREANQDETDEIEGLTIEEANVEDIEDIEDDNEVTKPRDSEFTWKHHSEDHSVYSGRSLMSADNIILNQDQGEREEDEGAEATSARKSKNVEDELDPLKTVDYAEKEWNLMFRSFDSAHDSLISSILQEIGKQTNLFEEIIGRLEPKCQRDIYYTRDSLKKHKLWALRMIDSNGKLPSGITYGRFASPGDYEECLSVRVDDNLYTDVRRNIVEKHKFHGKYCLIDFRLPMPERPKNKMLSIHESVLNFTGTEIGRLYPDFVKNYSAYASVLYEVGYLHAFCLPSTCDVHDLTKSVGKSLEGLYLIVNNTIDCEERFDVPPPIRKSQWLAIVLLTVVFVNTFAASIAYGLIPKDIRKPTDPTGQRRASMKPPPVASRKNSELGGAGGNVLPAGTKGNCLNFLEETKRLSASRQKQSKFKDLLVELAIRNKFHADCFSIQRNFERLTKPDPRGLTFVHYTRIVAMALTVVTHTGALGTLQAITKPADAANSEQIFRDLLPQMLANAFTSIQIFFFMAGFMLVISTYPSIKRDKGHMSFMEYAIKRAIRLMPGLAATICLNFIWPLFVDGPMLKFFDKAIVEPCEKNWWHTMFFLSNFDHVEKMCLRHSYFSASDYQLHLLAFPLLVLLYKQPTLALLMAALFTFSGFMAQVIMILTKNVLPFMMVDYLDKETFFNVVHYIHHPSWNHLSAFFYGFIIGYLVIKQVRVNISDKNIKRVWFILVPSGIISIFAPYFWNHYKRPIYKWQMVLYVLIDRFVLLSTCAWLSYATMVLARKPAAKKSQPKPVETLTRAAIKSPAEKTLNKGQLATTLTSFDNQPLGAGYSQDNVSLTSLAGMPRQRSSPNLVYLQQQQQQLNQADLRRTLTPTMGRLSRTVSSSNLAPIAEANPTREELSLATGKSPEPIGEKPTEHQQPPRPHKPAPVSNINILCLVLSRLTFQLYLFNMVVLCVDVNHSKYFWFFSYYFIIIKATSVYICSAIMAMIFFVVLESPCLTLYIAWVKGRASSKAHQLKSGDKGRVVIGQQEVKLPVPPPLSISIGGAKATGNTSDADSNRPRGANSESVELAANSKPTLSFIDLSSSSSLVASRPASGQPEEDNTKM